MKLLTIIYDSSIEASMKELLDALEVPGITWVYDVPGRGGKGPKMNSPVFPGSNNVAYLILTPDQLIRIHRAIRRLQDSFRLKPGITMFTQEIDVLP